MLFKGTFSYEYKLCGMSAWTGWRSIDFRSLERLMEIAARVSGGNIENVFNHERRNHKLILTSETLAYLKSLTKT